MKDLIDTTSIVAALSKRGLDFPLLGFSPGYYVGTCPDCNEPFMGAKRSFRCLPCAILGTIAVTEAAAQKASDAGFEAGRQSVFDDLEKLRQKTDDPSDGLWSPINVIPDVEVDTFKIPEEGIRLLDMPDDETRQSIIDKLKRSMFPLNLERIVVRPPEWVRRRDEETAEEWGELKFTFGGLS